MAITTLAKVKALLGTTSTSKDARIEALIEQAESDYLAIRNRPFDVGTKLTVETTGLPDDEEITITIGNYSSVGGTAAGREYDIRLREDDTAAMVTRRISNQIQPAPYYKTQWVPVSSTSTSAEMYFIEKMEDWMQNRSVLDFTVDTSTAIDTTIEYGQTIYPDGAEMTAFQMVQFALNAQAGVQSERLGDYSITYGEGTQGYPKAITGKIKKYVKML